LFKCFVSVCCNVAKFEAKLDSNTRLLLFHYFIRKQLQKTNTLL
jgi:hypothetical protein